MTNHVCLKLSLLGALALASGCFSSGELSVEEAGEPVVITTNNGTSKPDDSTTETTSPSTPDPDPEPEPEVPTDPMCNTGELLCDGTCLDVTADDANCGDCGNICEGGTVCMDAGCACEVGELCDGACVDTTVSFAHCGTCGNACAGGEACISGTCTAVTEVEGVLAATNAARMAGANCGSRGDYAATAPLEGDPELHVAAQVHADDMALNNFFSHTGSDGSSFGQRVGRTNYAGFPIGENIAAGQRSPQGVVDSWLDSDGHCANMMNPSATKIGIGYALGGPYGTLWVQVFGR